MADEPAFSIIRIDQGARFLRTGGTTATKVVTYMLGHNGPFTRSYDADKFSVDQVTADLQKEADEFAVLKPHFAPRS